MATGEGRVIAGYVQCNILCASLFCVVGSVVGSSLDYS